MHCIDFGAAPSPPPPGLRASAERKTESELFLLLPPDPASLGGAGRKALTSVFSALNLRLFSVVKNVLSYTVIYYVSFLYGTFDDVEVLNRLSDVQ